MREPHVAKMTFLAHDRACTVLSHARRRAAYSPFGSHPCASASRALGYTGQRREPVDGYLLGNGRRFYSPALMRFCQPDALSPFSRGGLNAYAYCNGNPTNRHDPGGQEALDLLSDIVGALGIVAYGAMMVTGYRLAPPSKMVAGVDVTLMASSSVAWVVGLVTDSDAAKVASIAASTLTALGRGALAAQWGRQALRSQSPPGPTLTTIRVSVEAHS